jgi:hypothetical protein
MDGRTGDLLLVPLAAGTLGALATGDGAALVDDGALERDGWRSRG